MSDAVYTTTYASPIGRLTLASDGKSITGLWTQDQAHFGAGLTDSAQPKDLPVFQATARWLDAYFAGKDPGKRPPLAPQGSPFRQAVWQALLEIPHGKTITYGDIARHLSASTGKSASPRAVGGPVGHNPISILIPCHRVVGKDGSLTGYAGGIDAKKQLLALEGAFTG